MSLAEALGAHLCQGPEWHSPCQLCCPSGALPAAPCTAGGPSSASPRSARGGKGRALLGGRPKRRGDLSEVQLVTRANSSAADCSLLADAAWLLTPRVSMALVLGARETYPPSPTCLALINRSLRRTRQLRRWKDTWTGTRVHWADSSQLLTDTHTPASRVGEEQGQARCCGAAASTPGPGEDQRVALAPRSGVKSLTFTGRR